MARKTIEQRIALDGGKEILDTLKSLGKEGEKAFKQIQDAARKAGSPGAVLAKSVEKLRKDLVRLGDAGRKVGSSFVTLAGSAGSFAGALTRLGRNALLASTALVGVTAGLIKFVKAGTDVADVVGKQAAALGLGTAAYGRLQFAAEQSGVESAALATSLTRLNVKLGEVGKGNEKTIALFRKLKVQVKDADGGLRSTELILGDLAERFRNLPDGAEKSALAVQLFGKSGAQLIPFLNEGRAGLQALGAQAEKLGLIFSEEQVRIATVFNDSLSALDRARRGLQGQLGILFAPALTEASEALQTIIIDNRDAILQLTEGAIAKAIPLVKDFINALAGNDADVQNPAVLEFVASVKSLASEVSSAITGIIVPAFQALQGGADLVAQALNDFTGSDFTGQQVLIAAAVAKLTGVLSVVTTGIGLFVSGLGTIVSALGLIGPAVGGVVSAFGLIATGAKLAIAALAGIVGIPALIVGGIVAAGIAFVVFFDEIVAVAKLAVDGIIGVVKLIGRGITEVFKGLGAVGAAGFQLLVQGASAALGGIITLVSDVVSSVVSGFRALPGLLSSVWDMVKGAAAAAWDYLKSVARSGIDFVAGLFQSLQTIALNAWQGVVDIVFFAWRKVKSIVSEGLDVAFSNLGDIAAGVWDGFKRAAGSAIDFAIGLVRALRDRIREAFRALKQLISAEKSADVGGSSTGGGATSGFARGGEVRGRGTTTSDSILARLSNKEFVVRAKAVQHYGPQLLHAINRMRLPRLPGFAQGGLVSASLPPMPSLGGLLDGFRGGLAGLSPQRVSFGAPAASPAGRPVVLQIGGERFEGLQGNDEVVNRLSRVAVRQQMASLGRRPSWYGR